MSVCRWVYRPYHPEANDRGMVPASIADVDRFLAAKDAPIMADRWREGWSMHDGTPVSSRKQVREFHLRHGTMDPGEFGADNGRLYFERKAAERAAELNGDAPGMAEERKRDIAATIRDLQAKKGRK